MNLTKEKVGPCRWKVGVEIGAPEVDREYEAVVSLVQKNAVIEGFRPGRAPRALVESKYSQFIREEVESALVRRAYNALQNDPELNIVDVVEIDHRDFLSGVPFQVTFTVDVAPTFSLPEYKNIPVRRNRITVADEEISRAKEKIRSDFSYWVPKTEGVVEMGELVVVDYEGMCEGKPIKDMGLPISEQGAQKDIGIVVGDFPTFPGLSESLIGAQRGERKMVDCTLPLDYPVPELAGKRCTFFVEVKGLYKLEKPAWDTSLFQKLGVQSEAELDEKIRQAILNEKEKQERMRAEQQILEYLAKSVSMELPEEQLKQEVRDEVREEIQFLQSQGQGNLWEDEEKRKELVQRAIGVGTARLRLRYILSEIAKKENIEATDSEIDHHVLLLCARSGIKAKKRDQIMKDPEVRSAVRARIVRSKVVDFLLQHAKIEQVEEEKAS